MTDRVVALVPARNEADRIAATVSALRTLEPVQDVVVVDDGSADGTAAAALAAGARVLRIPGRAGKGKALEGALRRLPPSEVWLLADGDLGDSARGLGGVLLEVLEGRADVAIATLPPAPGGGFGVVKGAARAAIRALCGFRPAEPLSGQRAVTAAALEACRPLARGFGVETAMTIDAVRAGFRVTEVATGLTHRPTGRGVHGFGHRGRQGLDILFAVLLRALRLR